MLSMSCDEANSIRRHESGHAMGPGNVPRLQPWTTTFACFSGFASSAKRTPNAFRTVVESVWFDDIASGKYDLAIGAVVSTLLDPSDYSKPGTGKDGPQDYSSWDNKAFQALAEQTR